MRIDDEFLFENILKTFFKLEQNITRLWWLPPKQITILLDAQYYLFRLLWFAIGKLQEEEPRRTKTRSMEQQEEDQYWPCCSASRTQISISNYDWTYVYCLDLKYIFSLSITIRSQLFEYYSNTELFTHLWYNYDAPILYFLQQQQQKVKKQAKCISSILEELWVCWLHDVRDWWATFNISCFTLIPEFIFKFIL